ncbi:uncharacterized protein [Argopecten irradians]|uniref:uncharacterized protein isoform X2 n=1 Tax=Argopecten irradians TaxID=31199 RepID=UPI0037141A81
MESEMDMEDFSNETNETDDENSDVEITFGPWPPFPSKPDCDDQDPINVESGDSDGLSEHCDEEQDSMESEGLVDVCNVEEVEDYATNDDIINHRVDDATNDDIINQCVDDATNDDIINHRVDDATNDDIINQCVDEATNDDIINQCVDEATNDDIINQCVDEATNDGIINQCVDKLDESETVDTIGQLNMDNSNEDVEFNFEHACQEIGLDVPEFIKYDENKSDTEIITNNDIQSDSSVVSDIHEEAMIETSSPTESDNVISKCVETDHINSDVSDDNEQTRPSAERDDVIRNCVETDRMNSDVSDNNEQISSPTESDYVISTCVPSESKEITSISLNSDVIDKLSETPTVTVKEEPVSDNNSDTEHTESAKDDNLFVSTEQGKMFLRSVATEPLSNNENGPKELDTDLILKELIVKKPGLCRDKSERFQKISKKLNVLKLKKMHYKESAQDKPAPMPGRIIGHDLSLVRGKRPDEFTPYQSLGHPVPKKLKLIKLSQNLEHDSTKIRKLQEHGTATITRKQRVISLARNLSPSSNDDMVTGGKVLNSLRVKPAGDTATTQDDGKVDLSLVKTEPLDYTEQDQGTSAPDSKVGETSSTSWIKKEPATEEKHFTETDKETNMPVPVKLIRNKLVNSVRSDSGVEDQEAKPPSTIVVGGKSICLQGGQKQMMYALPVGNQAITGMGDGVKQKKIVRVIKLSNTKSGPTVIPLTSNFKLVRIPKPLTSSPCQGEEIALSSLPRQNQISLLNNPTGKSTCEKDKNRMLKKIDGIIKENLKVIKKDWHPAKTQGYGSTQDLNVDHQKQQARPKFREEFDKDTGKTSVFLMPQKEEETIINKNIIYRYDRTRKTAAKKNQKVIDSSLKTVPLKTKALAVRPKVQVPLPGVTQSNGPDVTNKDPTACNKILDIAKAVMVKDAIMQTDPSQENIETDQGDSKETPGTVGTEKVGEVSRGTEKVGEVSRGTEKVGEVSGKTEISGGTGEVSSNHSEDTDLLMDVEDVDFINLDTKMAPDPLTVPRLRWKKSWRKTASVGVNTYIRTKVEDPVTPLHHEYVLPVDKPKPPRTASDVGKRKYYRHQWEKLKNLQKVVRRKNFLKTKQWEYECNVGKLKQKLEERKKIYKEAVQKDISQKSSEASESEVSEQIQQAGKEKSDILNQKVNEGKDDVKRDDGSSESSKNHVVEPGASIHSSCRIETQQKQAMENADMSKFFERVEQKLGDVQPVQVGYGQVITYMTDSSDEEWKEIVEECVTNKLQQLQRDLKNIYHSDSDSESIREEPDDKKDPTYSPDKKGQKSKKYVKVVANPQLWKDEYKKLHKIFMDVKLEDYPDMWERKLYTSNLRQERNVAVECKSYEEYRCRLCTGHHAYHTSAAELMESHLEEHLHSNFPCKECPATFDLQSLLTEHCLQKHSVTCEICNQKFSSQGLYKRHVGRMHGQRNIPCFKCEETFKTKLKYKQHLLEVHPGSAQECDKCGAILRSHVNALQGHQNSKNCLRRQQGKHLKTQCEICGKLVSENGIKKHRLRVHQKLRTFKCDVCPYAGITLQALNDHKKTHTGEHPVKCELCDFSCIKPYQLKCHMRTHLKLKPYKCDKCSYAASWNVQVKEHMRAHYSLMRVDCVDCNIAFKDQRGLNLHRLKEHGEGPTKKKGSTKKRGRQTRLQAEGDKSKNKRRTTKRKKKPSSEEDEYTDSDAEMKNELCGEKEKYIPRKSTRRIATKPPDPEYNLSLGESDDYDSEEQELADSYVPSVSKSKH